MPKGVKKQAPELAPEPLFLRIRKINEQHFTRCYNQAVKSLNRKDYEEFSKWLRYAMQAAQDAYDLGDITWESNLNIHQILRGFNERTIQEGLFRMDWNELCRRY